MAKNPDDVANDIEEFDADQAIEQLIAASDAAVEDQVVKQPFRVVYQTNNFLLPQVADLIKGDGVNLRPEYQRRLRWTDKQKSLLIESLLLNVPVPPVFFYENDLARYEVMDGQQRLNAIKEFLANEFRLRGLQIIGALNGRTYSKLPPRVKRSLDRASISAIVLLQESQGKIKRTDSPRYYELRRFVFERLNTGGKRLSAQEIRNAMYGGEFNNLIVELSRHQLFTRIWGIPQYVAGDPNDYYEEEARQKNTLYKTMGDCQLVLRFFALDDEKHINGPIKSILDRCMERYLDCSKADTDALGSRYLARLELASELFDGSPFGTRIGGPEYRPSAGIYDGVMAALDKLWDRRDVLVANKRALQEGYLAFMELHAGTGGLTGAANTAEDIRQRIDRFLNLFAAHA